MNLSNKIQHKWSKLKVTHRKYMILVHQQHKFELTLQKGKLYGMKIYNTHNSYVSHLLPCIISWYVTFFMYVIFFCYFHTQPFLLSYLLLCLADNTGSLLPFKCHPSWVRCSVERGSVIQPILF